MKKLLPIFILFFLLACTADMVEPIQGCDTQATSYNSNVKAIIDQTCAYSGCHDGAGGIGPGNYTNYQGILQDLESGSFESRVITQKDNPSSGMPPDNSVFPQSQQDSLSTTQLEIITCWLREGFPENE